MTNIDLKDLETVTGGQTTVRAPLSGDVNQINNGWGGTVNVQQAPSAPKPTTRIEFLRQNPEARWAPPPWKPMPVRPFGR
ncbi:MAG TPA: hypothetical protein VIV11_25345 [Kofleriaceae bacterium]